MGLIASAAAVPVDADVVRDRVRNINLILLVPHGRSGSMLAQSLFEGHPQIISFPYWLKSSTWRKSDADTPEQLVERFCEQRSLFGGDALHLGTNRDDHGSIDIDAFKRELLAVMACLPHVNDRSLLICAHLALARLFGMDEAKLKYLLVHFHDYTRMDVAALRSDFPDMYFIAMHRDPREEWVSYVRAYAWEYGEQELIDKLLEFVEHRLVTWNVPFLDALPACTAGHVKIVDLARLHGLQTQAMRELASWLRLEWSDTLTRSTFLGRPWAGNSFRGTPVYGLDPTRARPTWTDNLSRRDIAVLEYFFFPLLQACGYEVGGRPSRAALMRRVLLSRPRPFFPRLGSRYLTEREKINRAFLAARRLAVPRDADPSPRLGGWRYRVFAARHLLSFLRRSSRALVHRYSRSRLRRLEALGARYNGVQLSHLGL